MTECDRIIEKGFLPASFFEEETRCDFYIDIKRKKLWAVLLDLLNEFDRICTENHLTYFLSSGTLLGAVRHKGFIPWDDDIDLAMPREDYEQLLKLSHKFKKPYLLQTPYTDKGYFLSYAKIRNTNTTFASEYLMYNSFNQGCFIDIFPYDVFDPTDCEPLYERIKLLARCLGVAIKQSNPQFVNNDKEIDEILKVKTPIEIYEEIQSLSMNAGNRECKFATSLVYTGTRYEKKAYPIDCIKETCEIKFENLNLPAPIGYESILRKLYGNYLLFPPVEKRGVWHSDFVYEPDIPFHEFRNKFLLEK